MRLEQVLEDALAARVTRGVDGLDLNLGAHAEERVDAGSHAPSRAHRNFFEVNPTSPSPRTFGKRMILFPYMLWAACYTLLLGKGWIGWMLGPYSLLSPIRIHGLLQPTP